MSNNSGTGTRIRQWLMTGVSYMIPFVAAGGILIALSFMIGGYDIVYQDQAEFLAKGFNPLAAHDWAYVMFAVGAATFGFLVPVLSGFIAYAIADRPGLAPGFVGGAIAGTVGAGFLGGLITGFLGGFVALWLSRIKLPNWLRPLMPVVVIPLVATFITAGLMLVILGGPLKSLMTALNDWLTGLSGGSLIGLGIILGLMMAFDMGGPVNKVAYTFAAAGLTEAGASADANDPRFVIMAIVMAAGMTPPLGLALATVLRKKMFSNAERQNGKAAWLLGASFITEGAIPFAAADPLRVIPSIMIGSGVSGALVAAFGCTLRAPHGGLWVFGLVGNWPMYLIAVAIGTVVTALLVIVAKNIKPGVSDEALEEAVA
ncbi:PTS fructose transporter subunit IIC [uncultured Aurantimicrobium sp.]|uniref:PTS fructose transporter subunit IIC n=1 Tax=uncultured Aurantimicrobium sp. TaxID=1705357 RepID=UPI0026035769|nr:PTS fructose transporter subunit IIC [uncultured Aurantimicrobium sp.]